MEGLFFAKTIFSTFSRNIKYPLQRGIGIPTYFISNPEKLSEKIDWDGAEQICIFFLVDEHMIIDEESVTWEPEIIKIHDYCERNYLRTWFYPIAMHENANRFSTKLSIINGFNLYSLKEQNQIRELSLQIAFELAARLYSTSNNKGELPVTLFISHTNREERILMHQIKEIVDRLKLGLSAFMDVKKLDKEDSLREEIKKRTTGSILLVLNTDNYSSDESCIKNLLEAKKSNCPIIEVNASKKFTQRVFPYLGNIISVRLRVSESGYNNIREIISMVLLKVLYFKYHSKLNETILRNHKKDNPSVLYKYSALPPELLTLPQNGEQQIFLYPDPPLGNTELDILKKSRPNIDFVTPILFFTQNSFVENLENNLLRNRIIGISISESIGGTITKNIYNLFDHTHLEEALVETCRYLLVSGANLSYGGDINYSDDLNFTEILMDLVDSYIHEYENKFYPVVNHVFYPITELVRSNYDLRSKCKGVVDFKFYDNPLEERFTEVEIGRLAISLTSMRKDMLKSNEAQILIGGRLNGQKKGLIAGVLEEAYWALKYERPIYIVGAFGGVCKELVHILVEGYSTVLEEHLDNLSSLKSWQDNYLEYKLYAQKLWNESTNEVDNRMQYLSLRDFFKKHWIQNNQNLRNGLSQEENMILFYSRNMLEVTQLIIKGLHHVFNTKKL